jgi:8-oxo-dGTP pyrophosphatase MutT (NUDIX family)
MVQITSNKTGVHLNGYVRDKSGTMKVWIAQRSFSKKTDPGMMDNLVGGGIAEGSNPIETMIKEAGEEAGIFDDKILAGIRSCGTISCYYDDPVRGWQADTEYVFDLELPLSFKPIPEDGEVEGMSMLSLFFASFLSCRH